MNIECFLLSHSTLNIPFHKKCFTIRKIGTTLFIWLAISSLFHGTGLILPDGLEHLNTFKRIPQRQNAQTCSSNVLDNASQYCTKVFEGKNTELVAVSNITKSEWYPQYNVSTAAVSTINACLEEGSNIFRRLDLETVSDKRTESLQLSTEETFVYLEDNVSTEVSNVSSVYPEASTENVDVFGGQTRNVATDLTPGCLLQNDAVYHTFFLKTHTVVLEIAFIMNIFIYIGISINLMKYFKKKIDIENQMSSRSVEVELKNHKECFSQSEQPSGSRGATSTSTSSSSRRPLRDKSNRKISNIARNQIDVYLGYHDNNTSNHLSQSELGTNTNFKAATVHSKSAEKREQQGSNTEDNQIPGTSSQYRHFIAPSRSNVKQEQTAVKPVSNACTQYSNTGTQYCNFLASSVPTNSTQTTNSETLSTRRANIAQRANQSLNRQKRKRRNSIALVLAMTLFYCIFNAPQVIVSGLVTLCPNQCSVPKAAIRWAVLFKVIQSLGNVIVFLSKSAETRRELRKICAWR